MIPVIIIAYNQLTYIRNMVYQCLPLTDKIYIIDNASTYEPLIDYYENEIPKLKSVELIRHPENGGSHVWKKYLHLFPDEYIITDPDLLFNPKMPTNVISILSNLRKKFDVAVVGLALDISNHHDFTDARCSGHCIYDFEMQYWKNKIQSEPEEIYEAKVATTFALHSRENDLELVPVNTFNYRKKSLRVAGEFTCRHIPWYRYEKSPLPIPIEERSVYLENKKFGYWFQ